MLVSRGLSGHLTFSQPAIMQARHVDTGAARSGGDPVWTTTRAVRRFAVGAIVLGLAVVGWVAFGAAEDPAAVSSPRSGPSGLGHRPVASAIQPAQAEGFAVFARPRTAADRMPRGARAHVGNSTVSGRNLALSRAISTPAGTGWAVPGNGAVCLVVRSSRHGYGVTCDATESALARGVIQVDMPGGSDVAQLTMLAPNGSHVTAQFADGRTQRLSADADGVIAVRLKHATRLTVRTRRATETLPMPAGAPARLTRRDLRDCGGGVIVHVGARCPKHG